MFAVIFEVVPKTERKDEYLELAKFLRPEIEKIDGFLDNERFASRSVPGRVLSLSTWRDEKSVIRWRTLAVHHQVQEKGRFEVFQDYHLRVGEFTADSRPPAGQVLRQQRLDETEVGAARYVTISELGPRDGKPATDDLVRDLDLPASGTQGLLDRDTYESIYVAGKLLLLASWRDVGAADAWRPRAVGQTELWHRTVRVVRDYGMFDRREAPQYYPEVKR
ncbi:MAG TPA: antibiotic biosynthesis monooxygenase [Acetobacteraceae bacterium]|nr:antibiotic biosynthesis monooxygenase [Acetobacteraceae bacterium]